MKTVIVSALLARLLAIGLGFFGQSQPAADRPVDQFKPVPAAWYQALPPDPAEATRAYLQPGGLQ
jgi:hypothetical protein